MDDAHFSPSSNLSLSRVFWAAIWLMALIGLAPSWFGLMGDRHWLLDLMSHFRWQYLAFAGLVCLFATARRAWLILLIALATLVLNALQIVRFPGEAGSPVRSGTGLRVMGLNLLVGNEDSVGVLKEVQRVDPDVAVFSEVNIGWAAALEPLKKDYPHHRIAAEGVYGLAIFSKIPLSDVKVEPIGKAGFPILQATLATHAGSMRVIGAHPLPPTAPRPYLNWVDHLQELGDLVSEMTIPVLVAGDLNATPWCYGIRELLGRSDLAFRLGESGGAWFTALPTWSVGAPFGIHIDHLLCTPELVLSEYDVGRDVGSDHRAVVARVQWVE
jgi:endonuclease/exonuclease/phosphatase (EEP) superfamily protein YafD